MDIISYTIHSFKDGDVRVTAQVVEPANESGMIRTQLLGESAERFGLMGWVHQSEVSQS